LKEKKLIVVFILGAHCLRLELMNYISSHQMIYKEFQWSGDIAPTENTHDSFSLMRGGFFPS
jgi:hypothetical protein